jgi:hypothetical protein
MRTEMTLHAKFVRLCEKRKRSFWLLPTDHSLTSENYLIYLIQRKRPFTYQEYILVSAFDSIRQLLQRNTVVSALYCDNVTLTLVYFTYLLQNGTNVWCALRNVLSHC